jgi:transcriptional regulator with XRE-family HTH domain
MGKPKTSRPTAALRARKRKPKIATVQNKVHAFAEAIRSRRRELNLTQDEVADRIGISTPYVGHLESGKRHPSDKIVEKMAAALDLGNRELFFLANPHAQALISEPAAATGSTWEQFQKDDKLRRLHNVLSDEMVVLSQVALMGEVQSTRDLIYILTTIRHAVGR